MNKLLSLIKVQFKNISFISSVNGKKNKWWVPLLLIMAFIPLVIELSIGAGTLYDILETMEQQGIILVLTMGICSMIIFFFGIFYIMSAFYHSNDIETFLYMPLKPYQILVSKFIVVLVYEYIVESIFVIPVLIVYGIKSNAGLLYIIYSIISFILLPVVALVIASLIVMVIMRFTNIGKSKEKFKFIGGMLALVVALGLNFMLQRSASVMNDTEKILELFSQGNNSLINVISNIFPGVKFSAVALVESADFSGLINMLIFIFICIVLVLLFAYLGQHIYFKGVIGISESSARRQSISKKDINKKTVSRSNIASYVIKEIKLLMRSPIYFMNCVLMNFIWPVIFIIAFSTSSESKDLLSDLSKTLSDGVNMAVIIAGVFAGIMFISSMNGITPSAISREGKGFYIMKYLPMPLHKQLIGKMLTAVVMSSIGLVIFVIAGIYLGIDPVTMVTALIISVNGMILIAQTGMVFDILNPKLVWDNEQQAVKQNLNVLYNMLTGVLLSVGIMFFTIKFNLSLLVVCLILVAGVGILNILVYRFIKNKGCSMLKNINA